MLKVHRLLGCSIVVAGAALGAACGAGEAGDESEATGEAVAVADCNANAADGCEVDLQTSRTNCGDCFNVCETGTSCVNGACVPNDPCLVPPC
jgi:hypothetical protein